MERREISFAPGFFVDSCGDVFDSNGKLRTKYENGDGYLGVSIKTIEGIWTTFGVQRLVALSFIENDREDRTEVNHRDGDKTHNHVSNLEWVTPSENNIHSEISRRDNMFPTVRMYKNGVIEKMYKNIFDASLETNIEPLLIWDSIKDNKLCENIRFEFQPSKARVPVEIKKTYFQLVFEQQRNGRVPSIPVKILNIKTGDVQFFDSVGAAAKAFNTNTGHISCCIPKCGEVRIFKEKYQVQYKDLEFPVITEEELERSRGYAKDVVAYNVKNRRYEIFDSAASFVRNNTLSKKAVTTALKKGVLREFDGWIPIYLSDSNMMLLKRHVQGLACHVSV